MQMASLVTHYVFRFTPLLRVASGDAEEDFLQTQLVFAKLGQLRAAVDQRFGNDAVVDVVVDEGDLDVAVLGFSSTDLRARLQQLDGASLIAGDLDPDDASAGGMVAHALNGAGVDELAALDDGDAVAEGLELAEDVRADDDGFPMR